MATRQNAPFGACMNIALFAVVVGATVPAQLPAQRCAGGASTRRIVAIAGGFAAVQTGVILARHNDWWPTPTTSFHFTSGGSPSKSQDVLLHGAIAYQVSQLGALAWDWACISPTAAAWLGAALGIAVGLPKEIGDGLHEDKGFSTDDFGASVVGALLPALHRTFPTTRALALKVNYWPSAEFRNRANGLPQLENDYAGQRYFLTISPGRVPGGAGAWPDWLGLALGHSVPQWASLPPVHEWYVALDLNLRGLPIRTDWWQGLATLLDQIHFPMPGVRVSGGEVEVGLF